MTETLHLLADERQAFDAVYASIPEDARAVRPAPGAWSAALVLEHLVLVEGGSLDVLEKLIAKGDGVRNLGPQTDDQLAAVVAGLRSDRRFAIPASAAAVITPAGTVRPESLRHAWDGLDGRWQSLDGSLTERQRAVGLFRHATAGVLRADGVAAFNAAHVAHHRAQLERIRTAV